MTLQPLYINVPPVKQPPPRIDPTSEIILGDLTNANYATSVADAKFKFPARAAAAIYHAANVDIKNLGGADYGIAILAKWAYQDYFDGPAGDAHRNQTVSSLLQQRAGQTGTGGDYDILLNLYLTLLYKYYNDLQKKGVSEHIINELLNVHGPLDKHESEYDNGVVNVPETENHLYMIETARYLTNQLLYQRTHDPQFDNRRNGDGNDPQPTAVWILNALQSALKNDFAEYNARPYQDLIMMPLLNLASFAYDDDVRLAARMVLDYISAKVAVSSNSLRRAPPFRRRNEDQHWGPSIGVSFFLASPLLKPRFDYPDFEPDPQGAWYAMLAGNTELLLGRAPGLGVKGNFAFAMVIAGLHDYRVPDPILDLFINHRRTYQRFQHWNVIRDTGEQSPVTEVYAASPSYLITAGGHPTDYCYKGVALGNSSGVTADLGAAMPTTFMPTSEPALAPFSLTLDNMIQFGVYTDIITANDLAKWHLWVAPDFACGWQIYLPDGFQPDLNPDVVQDGNWTFVDRGIGTLVAPTFPSYFLAIYRVDNGSGGKCGFLEAYDNTLHLGSFLPISFAYFRDTVKANNPSVNLQFGADQVNNYVTCSGQRIAFTISPHSDIVSTTGEPEPTGYKDKFAHGTVLDSQQGSGIIVIS
jgi:hypothetical protein